MQRSLCTSPPTRGTRRRFVSPGHELLILHLLSKNFPGGAVMLKGLFFLAYIPQLSSITTEQQDEIFPLLISQVKYTRCRKTEKTQEQNVGVWACVRMRHAHTCSHNARLLFLGKEEQGDHYQIGEPPDSMAKYKVRVRPLPFLMSAFSSHPGNTSPSSQALGTLSPWFLFIFPPSPSLVPLVLYLHPRVPLLCLNH